MVDLALARRMLALLDLTSLNDDDSDATIRALCRRAVTDFGNVAAVCVYPRFAMLARHALNGPGVRVATVANFPDGAPDVEAAVQETRAAIADGADEVDVVFPYRALLSGDSLLGRELVAACKVACGERGRLKVILETGALADRQMIADACRLAIAGNADFLKTSTGKRQPGATPEAAEVMLAAIADAQREGRRVGFKAAGGVRTAAQAATYLSLADRMLGADWATPDTFRFGASALIDDLLRQLGDTSPSETAASSRY